MKILILNNNSHNSIGGAEIYSYHLIKLLIEQKHIVEELTIFSNKNKINEPLCKSTTSSKGEKTNSWLFTLIKIKLNLIKFIKNNDYDLIISNTVAWPCTSKFKKRIIFIQHNDVSKIINKKKNFLRRIFCLGSSYNYATDIVSYTESSGIEMKKINKKFNKIKFWDCLLFSLPPKKKKFLDDKEVKYITFIGRDCEEKRLDLICELSNMLDEKIRIVSDSNEPAKFNKFSNILYFSRKTHLEIMDEIIPTSKFIILLSDYEGLGFVFIEAFSFGIPIICRNSFQLASFLVNGGKNGILLPNKININEWANIINNNKYEFNSKEIINFYKKNFTYKNFLNKWLNIIDNKSYE